MNRVALLKNTGCGIFETKIEYLSKDGPAYVFCADLDEDSDFDLAVANWWSNDVSILINLTRIPDNQPPSAFSLLFPPNKAFTPGGVFFDWETATDPNPSDQVRYDLYLSTSYHFPADPDSTSIDSNLLVSEHTKTSDHGTYYWQVKARDKYGAETWSDQIRYFMVTGIHHLNAGDSNSDGSIDVADAVFLINHLNNSGPPPDPLELGDVNGDHEINIADVIYLINYLFIGGPSP
jgi:hypothetical protein